MESSALFCYLLRNQNNCPLKASVLNSHALQSKLGDPQNFLMLKKYFILKSLRYIYIQIFLELRWGYGLLNPT